MKKNGLVQLTVKSTNTQGLKSVEVKIIILKILHKIM